MEGGQKNVDELEKTQPLGTLIRWLQFDFQLKLCCRGVQLEGGVYELAYTPGDFHMVHLKIRAPWKEEENHHLPHHQTSGSMPTFRGVHVHLPFLGGSGWNASMNRSVDTD